MLATAALVSLTSTVTSSGRPSGQGCLAHQPCLANQPIRAGDNAIHQIEISLPGAPTSVTATATDGQAEVDWASPRLGGSHGISRYVVTSFPPSGAVVVPGDQRRALINDLPNGERFTFTVDAIDANGQSLASMPSNAVTPESLSTFTSTVSIRSVDVMFSGGRCVGQGIECFGIQQNSFVQTDTDTEYWIQNLVFVEHTLLHGWEAEGNYEIWSGTQQSLLACSGTIVVGPVGAHCQWPETWRALKFPARISLTSAVANGGVLLSNSLGNLFPSWSPDPGGVESIVDLHEKTVPSYLNLYAPETVIVGEIGGHTATFIGGSGSIASEIVLSNGRTGNPDTSCVTRGGGTSTGEAGVGFEWSTASQGGMHPVDFAARQGMPGDGDGVEVLPGSQVCV
jgi:hypothetical protein